MKTLIERDLVEKVGSPARYNLTDQGREIATKMNYLRLNGVGPSKDEEYTTEKYQLPSNSTENTNQITKKNESKILKKGTFDIFLVLDNREVRIQSDRTSNFNY